MTLIASHEMGFAAMRVLELAPGEVFRHACGDREWIVLPLAGAARSAAGRGRDPPGPGRRCSNSAAGRACSAA